jgi:hypothetical protein
MSDAEQTEEDASLRARVRELEQRNEELREVVEQVQAEQETSRKKKTTRRGVLAAAATGIGAMGLTGSARAQTNNSTDSSLTANLDSPCQWLGDRSADGYGIYDLGPLSFRDDSFDPVKGLNADAFAVDANDRLTVEGATAGQWSEQDTDTLLELPSWNGIDVGTVNTDEAGITDSLTLQSRSVDTSPVAQSIVVGLSDGLVGHWTFEDISGGSVEDKSGNGNDMDLINSPTQEQGVTGPALRFDSLGERGEIPADPSLDVTGGDFTISARFNTRTAEGTGPILQKRGENEADGQMGFGLFVMVTGGVLGSEGYPQVQFRYGYDGGSGQFALNDPGLVGAGPRYTVSVTYNAEHNRSTIWINGDSRATAVGSNPPHDKSQPIRTGTKLTAGGSATSFLNGAVGEIAIHNRELPPSEIRGFHYLGFGKKKRFDAQLRYEPLTASGETDAVGGYFPSATNPYQFVNHDPDGDINYYEASNLDSFPSTPTTANLGYQGTPQDFVEVDGTIYLYTSIGGGRTDVLSGPSLDSLANQTTVLSDHVDVGSWYEDGTTYLFAEDAATTEGVSAQKIRLFTATDSPDGTFSDRGTVIDATDKPFKLGDADVEKIDGVYWMFIDATVNHPAYGTALYRSGDLFNWELVEEDIKRDCGGDLHLFRDENNYLKGFTEFTGTDKDGVGVWDVFTRVD